MHMRGQPQRRFAVHLTHLGAYRFLSQATEDGRLHGAPYASDEPDPVGEASGPATPALLGSALGHCLSAALLEALRHAHVDVRGCETDAVAVVAPNAEGLPRIERIEVTIRPHLGAPSPRTDRCAEVFEKYCTVTSSVTRGIDVRGNGEWRIEASCEVAASEAD